MMRYFFILGANSGISAVEVLGLIEGRMFTVSEIYKHAMIVEGKEDLDVRKLMDRLGGTVKIGRVIEEGVAISDRTIIEGVLREAYARKEETGRVTFGLSAYALEHVKPGGKAASVAGRFKRIGMEVKRALKDEGVACRFVKPSSGFALTSVATQKNGLVGPGGFEYVVLTKADEMIVGITDAVQPFERFSTTDYGRPSRDAFQGMLPPKLARIMLNIAIARPGHRVMDPFCGSGTVLTEALQLGVRNLIGGDVNPDAIKSTRENIDWLVERGFAGAPDELRLFETDAREISAQVGPGTIDAIVTEPYLGPPRKGRESRPELEKRLKELTALYVAALKDWRPLLASRAPVVIALPVYITGLHKLGIDASRFREAGLETESLFPERFLKRMGVRATENKGLLYGRNDQHVWREIVRMRARE